MHSCVLKMGVDWVSPLSWFIIYVCAYVLKMGLIEFHHWRDLFFMCMCVIITFDQLAAWKMGFDFHRCRDLLFARARVRMSACVHFFFFTFDQPATLKRGLIEFHHCCDLLFVCVHAAVCVYYFWSASNLKMGVDLVSSLSWSVICDSHSFMYGILKLPLYNTLLPFFVQVFNWPWCLR